jgi:hypothetical protein
LDRWWRKSERVLLGTLLNVVVVLAELFEGFVARPLVVKVRHALAEG